MQRLLEFLRRLAGSVRPSRTDADLQEELRLHLDLAAGRQADALRDGALDATRRAHLEAGSVSQAMDKLRDQRGLPWLDSFRSDVVFGWRQIARRPVASAAAVISLGLAMGAALAAFRLVDAMLLRPLPVADASRLFVVSRTFIDSEQREDSREDFDYPTYRRYVERAGGQADLLLVGIASRQNIVVDAGEPERAVQQFVSGNVFPTLGLLPAAGRLIGEGDDLVPGGHAVAVLTHDYWQRRYNSDAAIVGRTFRIGRTVYTIIGVTSRGFTGTEPGIVTDFFIPSMMNPDALKVEGWSWFRIWLKLRADADLTQVRARLDAGFRADQDARLKASPPLSGPRLDAFLKERLQLSAASAGASQTQKVFRQPLWIVATLSALLLLVACANVANLLLARGMSRKIEMALRLSIGAARRRLIQLLLIESALLGLLGAALGGLFAAWAAPFIVSLLAPADRPLRLILDIDWRTFLTASLLTVVVTALFGLAPALRASAVPLIDALKETRGQRRHRRLTDVLVAAQTALCVCLLFAAGLFVTTLDRLQRRPLGFEPNDLVHMNVESSRVHQAGEWAQLASSLRELPRVESVTVAGWAPLTGNRWRSTIERAGRPTPETAPYWVSIMPGYLDTMRMRLVAGRDFRPGDRPANSVDGQPVPGVAIVNESFARVYFDGQDPVGQRVTAKSSSAPMEIVGLVADAVYFSLREANQPTVFVPMEYRQGATVLVRTQGPPQDLSQLLRREIPRLRPGMYVQDLTFVESLVTQQMIRERLLATLSGFFAVLALILAVVGIYGVLNYAVTREQREIGVRMALGAGPAHVVRMLTARLIGVVLAGAVAGIGLGLGLVRVVRTLLFQIEPTDPAALATPLLALLGAAVLAVLPPAVRAVRTDPARTIRTEG